MENRKYVYLTDEMVTEMDELLQGEHANAIKAFVLECVYTAIEGYQEGLIEGFTESVKRGRIKNSLLIVAGCGVIAGGYYLGKKAIKKVNERRQEYIRVMEKNVETN